FSPLERGCACMAHERQEIERCADGDRLSSAAHGLVRLRHGLGADAERVDPLVQRSYGVLLSLARLMRPLAPTGEPGHPSQEERSIADLAQELRHEHLGTGARPAAQDIVKGLEDAASEFRTGNPKIRGLEQVLDRLYRDRMMQGVVLLSE